MPRDSYNKDLRGRARRAVTALEIRQAEEIRALRLELRSVRAELGKRAVVAPDPAPPAPSDYHALLDHIWCRFEGLLAKGKALFGTCDQCGNIRMPCIVPLIEMERNDYDEGHHDDLIFPPSLASGGVSAPLRERMVLASNLATGNAGGHDSWKLDGSKPTP